MSWLHTLFVHPERKRLRWRRVCAAGALVLVLVAYVFRVPLLQGVAEFLAVDETPPAADLIFVLNGDMHSRPFHAAILYGDGIAPRVAMTREKDMPAAELGLLRNSTDISVDVMKAKGVPGDRIVQLEYGEGVTSTEDEARSLREYATQERLEKVVIVTSFYHSRRARWVFRNAFEGSTTKILMSPAPDPGFGPDDWWRKERGLVNVQNEYIKLVWYLFK